MTGRGPDTQVTGRGDRPGRLYRRARCDARRRRAFAFELLEARCVLSGQAATLLYPTYVVYRSGASPEFTTTATPTGLTPTQIRHAYGFDQISFGSVQGDGTGQTIAIIDAYDSPTIASDLHAFDAYWTAHGYSLPDPTSFVRVAQNGSTNYPGTDPSGAGNPNGTWEFETALDVEWAHALAPKANILLVEANSPSESDLFTAVNYARNQLGVVAVSMSFSGTESLSDPNFNSTFTTPSGHSGVTFLAATGDEGQPAGYPAYSPNVVAVGGTTLSVDSSGNYLGETGWSGSGGGISDVESQPAYQASVASQFNNALRTAPDVSFDADPNSGVPLYDSWDFGTQSPWLQVGGTSFSTPSWAALIAIADQGRVAAGETPLDGATQTLPKLYGMSTADFHDITSGNNGFAAQAGYDLVTGIGTPRAVLVVNDLIGGFAVASSTPANGATVSTPPADFTISFAAAYAPSTVAGSDLTVNGIAADSFTLTNSTTITFHYNVSPAATQGLETMAIAAGAISRQTDNAPLAAFSATFRYDALPIAVTSTTPASGSQAVLPLSKLTLHFNEAYASSSISTSNLSLSQGSVTSFSLVDSQTVTYNLSGVTSPGTFSYNMAAGAVTDAFGNPGPAYSGSLTLNNPPIAFPTLTAISPAGSLIYQNSESGSIATGSTDTYTLPLSAGQTLTILVTPSGGLQAQLGLSGPGVSTSAASASVGAAATLQSVAVATAGTYIFTVSGVSGTTGSYTIRVDLNAALSTATTGGAGNHTLAAGQNIDPSFVSLKGSAQRGAAVGTLASSVGPDGFGYSAVSITPQFVDISPTGPAPTPNAPILVGVDDGFTRLRSSNLGNFQFKFYNNTYNTIYISSNGLITFGSGNYFYTNTDLTTSPTQAAIAALWSDLVVRGDTNSGVYWEVVGSGSSQQLIVQWNDVIFYAGNPAGVITFEAILNENGTIIFNYKNLNSGDFGAGGATSTVGIKDTGTQGSSRLLVSYNSASSPFVGTGLSLEIGTGLATTATDYYAFSLAAGQPTTLAVAGQKSPAVAVTLENSAGTVLATGASPGSGSNVSSAINNFVAPAAGTYYAVVTGPSGATYGLVVTRGADFDTEVNGSFATAQNISGTNGVLGDILASPATPTENWYAINLTTGNQLFLQATALGSTTSQFTDNLLPQIQLYSPNDTLVASGQGSGASELLNAVATTSGTYRVRVLGANSTSGEYFLSTAVDATPPTVSIAAVNPNPSTTSVSQIQIQFNEPVNGLSLANLVLSANGGPNLLTSSQTLTSSDDVTYTLGNLAPLTSEDGTYTLSLAASSSITDASGGYLTSGASTTFVVNVTEMVTTTADSGPGSLRQALLDASGAPGLTHTIQFVLPAAQQTITPLSPLPTTSDPLILTLDSTQNVTIASTSAWSNSSGLTITGGGSLTDLGGVAGAGTLTVNAPTHFSTGAIIQGALIIGGSAGNRAVVTIAASGASGQPLAIPAVSAGSASVFTAPTGAVKSDSQTSPAVASSDVQASACSVPSGDNSLTGQPSAEPSGPAATADVAGQIVSDKVVVPKLSSLSEQAAGDVSLFRSNTPPAAIESGDRLDPLTVSTTGAPPRGSSTAAGKHQFATQPSTAAFEAFDSTTALDQVLSSYDLSGGVDDGLLDLLSRDLRLG